MTIEEIQAYLNTATEMTLSLAQQPAARETLEIQFIWDFKQCLGDRLVQASHDIEVHWSTKTSGCWIYFWFLGKKWLAEYTLRNNNAPELAGTLHWHLYQPDTDWSYTFPHHLTGFEFHHAFKLWLNQYSSLVSAD